MESPPLFALGPLSGSVSGDSIKGSSSPVWPPVHRVTLVPLNVLICRIRIIMALYHFPLHKYGGREAGGELYTLQQLEVKLRSKGHLVVGHASKK